MKTGHLLSLKSLVIKDLNSELRYYENSHKDNLELRGIEGRVPDFIS